MSYCMIPGCTDHVRPGAVHCDFHQPDLIEDNMHGDSEGQKGQEGFVRPVLQRRGDQSGRLVHEVRGASMQKMPLDYRLEFFAILCDMCARTDSPTFAERMEQRAELLADSLLEECGIDATRVRRGRQDGEGQEVQPGNGGMAKA